MLEVLLGPSVEQQAGAREQGAGEGLFRGATVEDVAHFIAEAAIGEESAFEEARAEGGGGDGCEWIESVAGAPLRVVVAPAGDGDAGVGRGVVDLDVQLAVFGSGAGDGRVVRGVKREDAGGRDE